MYLVGALLVRAVLSIREKKAVENMSNLAYFHAFLPINIISHCYVLIIDSFKTSLAYLDWLVFKLLSNILRTIGSHNYF